MYTDCTHTFDVRSTARTGDKANERRQLFHSAELIEHCVVVLYDRRQTNDTDIVFGHTCRQSGIHIITELKNTSQIGDSALNLSDPAFGRLGMQADMIRRYKKPEDSGRLIEDRLIILLSFRFGISV